MDPECFQCCTGVVPSPLFVHLFVYSSHRSRYDTLIVSYCPPVLSTRVVSYRHTCTPSPPPQVSSKGFNRTNTLSFLSQFLRTSSPLVHVSGPLSLESRLDLVLSSHIDFPSLTHLFLRCLWWPTYTTTVYFPVRSVPFSVSVRLLVFSRRLVEARYLTVIV